MVWREGKQRFFTYRVLGSDRPESKPGASAVSTYMSNKCIGLNPEGYGALLGEVTFSCSRVSESLHG